MSETPGRRRRLAQIQNGICPACMLSLPEDITKAEVDHIIPRCRGGPDLAWNRRLVHFKCNRDKGADLIDEAIVLADEYGVVLHEPAPWNDKSGRGWTPSGPTMYPCNCADCGAIGVTATTDPEVVILCATCYTARGLT